MFPSDYTLLQNDGKSGWCTIFRPITYDIEGFGVWCFGLQVYEDLADRNKLRLQGWSMNTTKNRVWTGFHPSMKLTKGQTHILESKVILHETNGFCEILIDGVSLYKWTGIMTDPRRILGDATPRVCWRHYTANDTVSYPQKLYMTDMVIQDEPFQIPDLFKCDVCGLEFETQEELDVHILTHEEPAQEDNRFLLLFTILLLVFGIVLMPSFSKSRS